MKFIAVDPSGNFKEGKGTTGWAVFEDGELKEFGEVKASNYNTQLDYWGDIIGILSKYPTVVCESYRLQPSKSMAQSWSALETPQLIGVIRYTCKNVIFQDPVIKKRFTDEILITKGVVDKEGKLYKVQGRVTNDHMRDAIRHGLYHVNYGKVK
jgi:hypothetical protein